MPKEQDEFAPIGAPGSSPALKAIDDEVRVYGIDGRYERIVTYVETLNSGLIPRTEPTTRWAVVDYRTRPADQQLRDGVQVWIDRRNGRQVVVPKSVIRAADLTVLTAGHDLTSYKRGIERAGDLFYVTYQLVPPRPGLAVLGGALTVTLNAKTGLPVGDIHYQQ